MLRVKVGSGIRMEETTYRVASKFILLDKYYHGNQVNKEMGSACGIKEIQTRFLRKNLKKREEETWKT